MRAALTSSSFFVANSISAWWCASGTVERTSLTMDSTLTGRAPVDANNRYRTNALICHDKSESCDRHPTHTYPITPRSTTTRKF
jgi:hypothetical protein